MLKATQFIVLDSHRCQACWQCIDLCPKEVIGKFNLLFHKHSRIAKPEACVGCKKCVKNCPKQAIYELSPPGNHQGRGKIIGLEGSAVCE